MGAALIALSIVFAIGGFICLYEEQSQADELAWRAGEIERLNGKLKDDDRTIEEMGQSCQ